MFNLFFKHVKPEAQGMLACILGLILILGTFGKLQVLQSLLNSVMIIVGIILVIWGLRVSNGIAKIQALLQKKNK
jgi:hypothetical protein